MPKRKSLNPTKAFTVYVSEENTAQLELLTYQPGVGRNRFGEVSRIFNEALTMYFARIKEQQCQSSPQPKPPSDSPS